jgi:hypothetical protein
MANTQDRTGADLYAVLGLTPDASSQEIRAAYQQLAGSIVAGHASPIQRQAIEEAFETLGDPIRRLRYDAQAAAPPPPRFQIPVFRLPGVRVSLPAAGMARVKRPALPQIDPMLAAAIALVGIVGAVVLLLPLVRGRGNPSPPAQSVSDLVASPTGTPAATQPAVNANAQPGPRSPIVGGAPGGFFQPGQGTSVLPPLSGSGPQGVPTGGLLGPPPAGPQGAGAGEPPFLTGSAILDMLRAIAAASAVRNAPPPGAQGPPPSITLPPNASNNPLQPSLAPAGIPITSLGSIPPVANAPQTAASFPSSSAAATPPPPAPTATPAPNHISVPGSAVTAPGVGPAGATRPPATSAPNRFVPAPTPVH